ncbi:UDP-N-acetylmuramoyl-L-alanine--D-glutamate ligase [Sulfurospirillum arcachonense]|uniref:UDP-N-acetylmuramoyl-L-alanine--D-glutamate ligase n=1 Tax=Sulfurospirillum arcachonense TaxID=57666 RepID=UPI00046AB557|nr:UDP-N-acetylmuramoyl-L-alanine--D-glutamate ligase [Sulfurospirillum arcachonense]
MISLFGYGKTTKAIAKKLQNCLIFDDNFKEESVDEYGNRLLPPAKFSTCKSTMQIPSPGFPPQHELVKNANNLVSEYDFFHEDMPFSIWISGTNGKTTTTQMATHLLKQKGAISGGNIGTPLAELDKNAPIWILESSSFTLHYTKKATPGLYLLLPIKPDHISWHQSFEEYEKAKLTPLDRMKEGSVVIIPKEYENYPTNAKKITYTDEYDLAKTLGIDIKKVEFKSPFLMDAILAMAPSLIIYDEIDYAKINSFKTDIHKLEEFTDNKGRIWVDDTKGTNVDATIEALKRYKDEKILLILGGDDKGVSLDPLFEIMKPLHVKIFAIGSNTDKIVNLANKINKEVIACYELKDAMPLIHKEHTNKTLALLSPAAASLDQFSSYAQRGELFKKLALL